MLFIIVVISLISTYFSWKSYKCVYNPYTVFNLLWSLVGLMLLWGHDYIYTPSDTALWCVILGIVGYNFSSLVPKMTLKMPKFYIFNGKDFYLDQKRALWISNIILIFSIISAYNVIISILSGATFYEIRTEYFTVESEASWYIYYIREFIISPLRYVVIISAIISFFNNYEKKWRVLFNAIMIVVLQALTSGGRYVLMNSLFMFIAGFFLFKNTIEINKINRSKKCLFSIVAIIFITTIVYLTDARTSYSMRDASLFEKLYDTIYSYFAGSVTYLGKVAEVNPEIIGSTFGINFMAGILRLFVLPFVFVGAISYPEVFTVIAEYACAVLQIGPFKYYNAMPTIFGYFYIDGGLVFVFLESCIFGYMCKRIYKNAIENNLLYKAFYILIFIQICDSSTRWFFYSTGYVLAYIYILFFIKRTKLHKN